MKEIRKKRNGKKTENENIISKFVGYSDTETIKGKFISIYIENHERGLGGGGGAHGSSGSAQAPVLKKKKERSQINYLPLQLKKASRRKDIMNIGVQINKIENKKKINGTKILFFEKIMKVDKTLGGQTNNKKEKTFL
jgi:hypothetical protein